MLERHKIDTPKLWINISAFSCCFLFSLLVTRQYAVVITADSVLTARICALVSVVGEIIFLIITTDDKISDA